jgi:hypothetical protein
MSIACCPYLRLQHSSAESQYCQFRSFEKATAFSSSRGNGPHLLFGYQTLPLCPADSPARPLHNRRVTPVVDAPAPVPQPAPVLRLNPPVFLQVGNQSQPGPDACEPVCNRRTPLLSTELGRRVSTSFESHDQGEKSSPSRGPLRAGMESPL